MVLLSLPSRPSCISFRRSPRRRTSRLRRRLGCPGKVFRSAPDGAADRGAIAGRRSPLRSNARGARRRRQGPGDQTGADSGRHETEKNVVDPFLEWKHNGRPAGNGWNRSTNNARFGVDYFNRTGTAKSNMFDNKPTETQYFYTDGDTTALRSTARTIMRSRLRRDGSRRSMASGHSRCTTPSTSSIRTI